MSTQRTWHLWFPGPCLFCAAALALCMVLPVGAGNASTQSGINACEQRVQIKDYLAHVKKVAPVRSVPESGKLPFAPRGVSLQRLGNGPNVGATTLGFALYDEAINWPRRLNWVIKATLVKVNTNGKVLKFVERKTERIGTSKLEDEAITGQRFDVSGNPAYYRVNLDFENFRGRKLGSYSEYFRVMKPRYRAVMTLSDEEVRPGQTIRARIENLGTELILAEVNVAIERHDGTQWTRVATVYRGGKALDASAYVFGGETGPCFTFGAPVDLGSGQFRVTETIRRHLRKGQRKRVSASFQIKEAEQGSV